MSATELLLAAAAEVREANQEELAEAVANAAYLLGVLRQVGTGLGHAPPQQVLVGLQGLRLWSLQLRDIGKPPASPLRAASPARQPRRGDYGLLERHLAGVPDRLRGRSVAPSPSAYHSLTSQRPTSPASCCKARHSISASSVGVDLAFQSRRVPRPRSPHSRKGAWKTHPAGPPPHVLALALAAGAAAPKTRP
jgi:hypothetical protein